MHDPGRIAAAIELLTECEVSWACPSPLPADIIIHRYFKTRRYIGSKDRGAIAALTYFVIRHHATLQWWAERHQQTTPRSLVIAALILHQKEKLAGLESLFDGDEFAPAPLSTEEKKYAKSLMGQPLVHLHMPNHVRYNYPLWMEEALHTSLGEHWQDEIAALNQEAPVDLRTNTLLTSRDALLEALKKENYDVAPTPLSPIGIRMTTRTPIFTSQYFKQGWFEMQDEGSQFIGLLLNAKPGWKVIDFCAGAGGKTLALAADMKNKGRILAWDTSAKRLEQMTLRLRRAHVDNVQRHVITSEQDAFIKRHKQSADAVLVDAPCSGSGTWRRNPDLKWRTSEKDLQELMDIQRRILVSAARLVKPNGYLLYVTCSLLQSENERQIEAFLQHNEKFRVVLENEVWNKFPQRIIRQGNPFRLTPHQDSTDGFFASLLQRCQ